MKIKNLKLKIGFSVIIPNFNGSEFLKTLLPSLLNAINLCPQSQFEIILVDNASTDDSLEIFHHYIQPIFPILSTKYLALSTNQGFAGAVKVGIDKSNNDYVCLLNNDLVLDKLWFNKIADFISKNKDKQVATICGTVLNKEGTHIESQGLEFFPSGKAININNGRPILKSYFLNLKSYPVWGSSAAAVVYLKNALLKAGSYDPVFFNYLEDVDVSFRLHQKQFKTICLPTVISYHVGGGTSSRFNYFRQYYSFRNWFFFIIKNYQFKDILQNFPSLFIERLRNLAYLLLNCPIWLTPILPIKALLEILYYFPKLLKSYQ
ncbi:glycosyltransferase family 2 protein [Candidatus Shapirobacteria bacterium]|nr:glycosyltransferase family 2 protein [Candidatus Shapirobacteria bacterium]